MNCPVCPQTDISSDAHTCPNCGVNLAPLRRLEELPGRYFNEALALAGRGRVADAAAKVATAIELGAAPVRARLLLGKLLWNLGRGDEARDSWRLVLEADPNHAEARRLLEMATRASDSGVAPAIGFPWLLAGVLLLALAALLVSHLAYRQSHSYPDQEVARFRELSGSRPTPPRPGPVPREDWSGLLGALARSEGVTAHRLGDRVRVVFHEGLFGPGSDRLLSSTSAPLRSLAGALLLHCRDCRIFVEGMTDSSPMPRRSRWGDNAVLAFARARRAADVLRSQGADAPPEWLAVTSGFTEPPYPNDTRANRQRNRTIVLHIWPGATGAGR